jgi:hypothetical protein
MSCSSIFIADVAAALDALDVRDEATERRIMALLGVEPVEVEEEGPPSVEITGRAEVEIGPLVIEPPPDTQVFRSYRYIPSVVESVSPKGGTTPALRPLVGAAPLTIGPSERDEPRPPLTPLLRASSTRAILSASLSTETATGVDIRRAVGIIVRREPFDRLPLKMIRSVRRGAQLLLDKSAGMSPFFRDQAWLSEWIARVVGRQRIEIASFAGVPQHGLHRGLKRIRAYRPPPRGTPVVLLTDLGIAQAPSLDNVAGPAEWLAFAALARRAGCPLIAFVPYPSERWSAALQRAMTILRWDRHLTAGGAAKRVASARR